MRGKPPYTIRRSTRGRIIPAHAGQTVVLPLKSPFTTDHPRACGANNHAIRSNRQDSGSSPRMRGKLAQLLLTIDTRRIIPAHAGQTTRPTPAMMPSTDHPRACGANAIHPLRTRYDLGSSPRMRGKPRVCSGLAAVRRIIPAHAGQTTGVQPVCTQPPDHPRACGANDALFPMPDVTRGSSPRMRGKPTTTTSIYADARIIPAHAGQTGRAGTGRGA